MKHPYPDSIWETAVSRWLLTYQAKNASAQTVELRDQQLRRFATAVAKPPWQVTEEDVNEYLFSTNRHWANETRIAARSALQSFYKWGARKGHIAVDPLAEVVKPRSSQPRPRPVPNDTYQTVLAGCTDRRQRVTLRLAGELGLRRGEVAALHWGHIVEDADGYWLRFVGKGDKERTVPLPDDLHTELVAAIESTPGGFLWPKRFGHGGSFTYRTDEHITPHWIGTLIARLLPDGYTMHKLRHRAGTEAYRRSGNDIYLASKLLGHSSVTTTQVYVKADMSRLRAAVTEVS